MTQPEDKDTHQGSMGTDRNPPAGTELPEAAPTREEIMKQRIAELRKRDPFIYK
jgi:hypothetical protein